MYRAFYGMTGNPFRKDIPVSQLFESDDLRAFRSRMEYFKQTLGLAVVYGRPGLGKTTALRALSWTGSIPSSMRWFTALFPR